VGFVNGNIYLSFKPLKSVSGLLVHRDRVLYAGPSNYVAILAKSLGGALVDLRGRAVVPGFIDAHLHLDSLGLSLLTLNLRGVKSIRELKEKLGAYARVCETSWVLGHGWDHELFEEKRWPSRWDLDEVVPDRPVLLTRLCLHAGVLNTRAMELAGLLDSEVKGVLRDSSGKPTGVVVENALKVARDKVRETLSREDYVKLIKVAQEHLISSGVTTVGIAGCDLEVLKALFELWSAGELVIRVRVYLNPVHRGVNVVNYLQSLGIRAGYGDKHLKIMGIKLFVDGALGPRTAWLSKPYSDDPSTSGYPIVDLQDFEKTAKLVDAAGLQLAVHAIGDKAVEFLLTTYRELKGTRRLRHRVEHASLLRDDEVILLGDLGTPVVVQPHFILSDWWALDRLGRERVKWLYRFKTIVDSGIPLAFSTDAPVEPVNPWRTIYAAVTRGKYESVPSYEYTKDESMSVAEALHCYTAGSAYAVHEEHDLGSLEPGKLADFVVLDRDPLFTPEHELTSIRVEEVYIGGTRVY